MSVETIIKCDKCGRTVFDRDGIEIFTLGLVIYHGIKVISYDHPTAKFTQQWCIDCMIKAGLMQRSGKKDLEPSMDDAMTLDDFVRDMVREVINEDRV